MVGSLVWLAFTTILGMVIGHVWYSALLICAAVGFGGGLVILLMCVTGAFGDILELIFGIIGCFHH